MLREDFSEIFDYLTARSDGYTLNTNGTLITPAIARLLVRKGIKLVALYGATADVHDHVTRTAGSFAAAMRGIAYLQEAGAGFVVQVVPMRDNWHQYHDMLRLAGSLGPHYRVGAAWLNLSASASGERNAEILRQRLAPADVVALDPPGPMCVGNTPKVCGPGRDSDDRLFASCILRNNEFHVDPYGGMSFCSRAKDPALRFDLRTGGVRDAWEEFLPGLAERTRGGRAYLEGCGACALREDCHWCAAHAFLEHGQANSKVEYLCQIAREARAYRENWRRNHRRHFQVAGVTIQVDSDLPMGETTFANALAPFAAATPGSDTLSISHHFGLPVVRECDLGREVYRKPPWAVFRKGEGWVYLSIDPDPGDRQPYGMAEFNEDHSRGRIYHAEEGRFRAGGLASLTMFPTDQILLARALAERQACVLHSAAVVVGGAGLLFAGHSDAGKSTTVKATRAHAQVLCDDRNIVRRWPEGFRVHGTWSHGEIAEVSAGSAPLAAILLLRKSNENRLVRIEDPRRARNELLGCVIKPLLDQGWWEKTLDLVHAMAKEIPCYEMYFDRTGAIVPLLLELARAKGRQEAAQVAG